MSTRKQFVPGADGQCRFPTVSPNALRGVGYADYLTAELPPYPQYPDQLVYDTSVHLGRIING